MTRKRFIKLLMAHGYQIREAEACAWIALKNYGSYQNAWEWRWHRVAHVRQMAIGAERMQAFVSEMICGAAVALVSPVVEQMRAAIAPLTKAVEELARQGVLYE